MGLLLEPPNVASTSPQLCHTVVLAWRFGDARGQSHPPKSLAAESDDRLGESSVYVALTNFPILNNFSECGSFPWGVGMLFFFSFALAFAVPILHFSPFCGACSRGHGEAHSG